MESQLEELAPSIETFVGGDFIEDYSPPCLYRENGEELSVNLMVYIMDNYPGDENRGTHFEWLSTKLPAGLFGSNDPLFVSIVDAWKAIESEKFEVEEIRLIETNIRRLEDLDSEQEELSEMEQIFVCTRVRKYSDGNDVYIFEILMYPWPEGPEYDVKFTTYLSRAQVLQYFLMHIQGLLS